MKKKKNVNNEFLKSFFGVNQKEISDLEKLMNKEQEKDEKLKKIKEQGEE
tara:strand:- start:248 stop:397 length:150 start_codon:yes stop_codon:yes gene_type:complete